MIKSIASLLVIMSLGSPLAGTNNAVIVCPDGCGGGGYDLGGGIPGLVCSPKGCYKINK